MPADVKPLFRPDAVRPNLTEFTVPPAAVAARPKLAEWVKLLETSAGKNKKETELLPAFLTDVFVGVLGYTPPPAAEYTFKREALVEADGKFADAALGRFGGEKDKFVAVLEARGRRTRSTSNSAGGSCRRWIRRSSTPSTPRPTGTSSPT